MSLEEKVGQIIQPEIKFVTPQEVRDYHLGAVLNGGGTVPNDDKSAPLSAWVELADAFYAASMDKADGGVPIPVLWGSDAVHGHNNVRGATLFPHNIGLGAARDPELIRRIGAATAREVRATGLDWTFAPTVAVVDDVRWGRTYESYAEDPALVGDYARAMVEGIQGRVGGPDFLGPERVIATAKHYVGDGGTHRGIDRGDTRVSESALRDIHAAGFIAALEAGAQTVMASFNSWNGERLHGHEYLLTDILKGQMGFDGFLVGDWNGHRFVEGCNVERCPAAIEAGLDLFMVPSDWKALYHSTLAAAREGELSAARLDDAVRRILRIKLRAGLFEAGPPSTRPLAGDEAVLGSGRHRALAREAVRKSLVLLRNSDGVLPVDPSSNVLLAGPGADDITMQSGGWTLSWQGTDNTRADFPNAMSIAEGLAEQVAAAGGELRLLAPDQDAAAVEFGNGRPADVAIAVYGETPYAEWHGDVASIEYQVGDKRDLALLRRLRAAGAPVVSVFLSGRPLWVNPELNASDAFVAAWLPGSEGGGVADVLLRKAGGEIQHDFVGRLSYSWPREVGQTVLSSRDADYDPLFAYGFGLDYAAPDVSWRALPEAGSSLADSPEEEIWLFVSRVVRPWKLALDYGDAPPAQMQGNRSSTGPGQAVTVTAIDRESQEDARQVTLAGGAPSGVSLVAPEALDLQGWRADNAVVRFDVRLERGRASALDIVADCAKDCSATLPLLPWLANDASTWQTVSVPLACLAEAGLDLSAVTVPFGLRSSEAVVFSLSDIRIARLAHAVPCEQ